VINKDEILERWAPAGAPWSKWVKPVLFAYLVDGSDDPPRPRLEVEALLPPGTPRRDPYREPTPRPTDVAVLVDLPGDTGVGAGLVLAGFGFQPVPLYNALPGPRDVEVHEHVAVDVWPVVRALAVGARALGAPAVSAPPAFLLDSRRLAEDRRLLVTHFDNRSFSNWSDFPTAETLRARGIRRVVLWGELKWDVAVTLRRWQQAGLSLYLTRDGTSAQPLRISVWARLRHWFESQSFQDGPGTS
jgi:hypothetical protein